MISRLNKTRRARRILKKSRESESKIRGVNHQLIKLCNEVYETNKIETALILPSAIDSIKLIKNRFKPKRKRTEEIQQVINNRKQKRLQRIAQKKSLKVKTSPERGICEQGSSSSYIQDDKEEEKRVDLREQTPTLKNKKKLRKVSNIKNSFSLRVTKKSRRIKPHFNKDKIYESENDFSSNRDYSEEQGLKANLLSTNGITNSIITKSDTKNIDISKTTLSSIKHSRGRSIINSGNNRKIMESSIVSGDSSWNSDTMSHLNSVTRRKYDRMPTGKKLESIFKIYNRGDMITKLNTLRKHNHKENFRTSHHQSTGASNENGSSAYLVKLEKSKKKFNTSLNSFRKKSNNLIPEVVEGEMSQEATPNNSTKYIKNITSEEDNYTKFNTKDARAMTNFKGAFRVHSEEKAKKSSLLRKSTHTMKNRRMLKTYLTSTTQVKSFVPLKSQQMTAKEVKQNLEDNESYLPPQSDGYATHESSDSRLARIYIRSGTTGGNSFRNKHMKRHNCSLQGSVPRSEYIPGDIRDKSYMDLSKPLFWKRRN